MFVFSSRRFNFGAFATFFPFFSHTQNAILGENFVRTTERPHARKHSLKISTEQNGLFSTHLLGIVIKRTPVSFLNIFAIRSNISPRSSGSATQFKTIELRTTSNSSSQTLRAKKSRFSIFGCCEFKSIERNRIQLGDWQQNSVVTAPTSNPFKTFLSSPFPGLLFRVVNVE